jgi:hypothetical protein
LSPGRVRFDVLTETKGEGMVWQHLKNALLVGAFAAAAALPARAGDCCAPACAAPCTRTVCCTEYVPEQYQCTRTTYKVVCKEEAYTAHRCECVPETRTCTRTVCKPVQETTTVMKTVCECVPTCEQRTVMQQCVSYVPCTKMCKKVVDKGHWECREVPCGPSLGDRLKKCFKKDDCCEPCCVKTKTVKCWVPCKVCVEYPVTTCQRVVTCKPVTVNVTVMKRVEKQVPCQVTTCKMVENQETYNVTVMVQKQVAYQATRTVRHCVPVQETVTATRYVAKQVMKEVPVTTCCKPVCCEKSRKCGGWLSKKSSCGCN